MVRVGRRFHRENPLLTDDAGIVPIHPEQLVAEEIVGLTQVPGASQVHYFEDGKLALIRLRPSTTATHVYGRPLRELDWPEGWVLCGVSHGPGRIEIATGETVIEPGQRIYTIGQTEKIHAMVRYLGREAAPTKRVLVAGAGQVGTALTRSLVAAGVQVSVVDHNRQNAFDLAAAIPEAVALEGNATDPAILREAGVEECDYFISATQNDMTNVLSSLLAREMGARLVVALYNSHEYYRVMRASQIDLPLSPRLVVAGTILRTVRRREILSLDLVAGGDAEVVEFKVPATARVLRQPLKSLKFPRAVVGAVVRDGRVIRPDGEFKFAPGDHVLIFTLTKTLPELERMFRER